MTQTISGLSSTVVIDYTYDATGNLTQTATTIGGTADAVTDYTYDSLGRVIRIEQYGIVGGNAVAEKRIDLTYDARSQYATISYYSDLDGGAGNLVMTATYTYDHVGQLTDLVYTDASSATIRDFEWVYNAVGWITSHDSDIATEDVTSYTYGAVGQLIGADYASSTDESYTYDENGNRITANGDSYTTGDANQTTSDGTYQYDYDANGNLEYRYVDVDSSGDLTSGDTDITEYTWDNRNRLVEVSNFGDYADYTGDDPSSVIDYVYDMFNRRIGSLSDTDGDGDVDLEERYSWQGDNVALDFVDEDGDGGTYFDELTTRYLWGQAVDQLLAQESVDDGGAEDVLYPVTDNLGSVRSLVEYDGDIAATYSYDSYGNVTVLVGSITDTRYQFTGQEYDASTGLYYYDARWYDPTLGKFISEDPITFFGGDTNLYRYVSNNPLKYVDPWGYCKSDGPANQFPPGWITPKEMFPDEPKAESPAFPFPSYPGIQELPPDIPFDPIIPPPYYPYIPPIIGSGSPGWDNPSTIIPPNWLEPRPDPVFPTFPSWPRLPSEPPTWLPKLPDGILARIDNIMWWLDPHVKRWLESKTELPDDPWWYNPEDSNDGGKGADMPKGDIRIPIRLGPENSRPIWEIETTIGPDDWLDPFGPWSGSVGIGRRW